MNTKLVYALTCDESGSYIEQALLSIYTARYHNPNAHIVLLTDDKTDKLLNGVRGQLLQYVDEKIVIPFEDDSLTAMYRSRWIKTSARRLVRGPILYIDCDTIIMRSLASIDNVEGDMVMVHDAHMVVSEYTPEMFSLSIQNCDKIGFDARGEKCYYNGGVILVKDTEIGNRIFDAWHEEWKRGTEVQFYGDEPSLMKSNAALGYVITELQGVWNCQVFMNPAYIRDAYITHYWWVPGKRQSFIYTPQYMQYLKKFGITEYVKECVLHPVDSMLPGLNTIYRSSIVDFLGYVRSLSEGVKGYVSNVDAQLTEFPWPRTMNSIERVLFDKRIYKLSLLLFLVRTYAKLHITNKKNVDKEILCTQ